MTTPAFLQDVARHVAAGRRCAGLGGDALGFALAQLTGAGRWLVVVDQADRAEALGRALRAFHADAARVEPFPDHDVRPYDGFSPSAEIVAARLRTLERVRRGGDIVVVAEAAALLRRVPDADTRSRGTRQIEVGDTLDRDALVRWLTEAGYLAAGRADAAGRFAVRGDTVDVWSTSASSPTRIEFFDDEVEALRRLDRHYRVGKGRRRMALLPAREERIDALARERFAAWWLGVEADEPDLARRRRLLEDLEAGVRWAGIEDWLPALVPTEPALQALEGLRVVTVDLEDVGAAVRDVEATASRRYAALSAADRPRVPPEARFVDADGLVAALRDGVLLGSSVGTSESADFGAAPPSAFVVRGAELQPAAARLLALAEEDVRVVVVAESPERASTFDEMVAPHGVRLTPIADWRVARRGRVSLWVGDLARGFVAPASGWAFVPLSALFGARRRADRERAHTLFDAAVQSAAQLKEGDLVVHRVHGVGRYLGLQRLPVHDAHQDFAKLEYRNGDLLFVPVTAFDQLSAFTPARSDAAITLDRLGGQSWERRKGKVRDSLLQMAEELLRVHARRELATRDPFDDPGGRYRAFEARFPHVETPDQATAIEAVQEDLSRPYPMDRLLCGDVGFGKTEVAMRAAMRVVASGRQVAVLCPTTVLAYQHHRTFTERFSHDPEVRVAMLSRFVDAAEASRVRDGVAAGDVHIVIGTTSLLGRSVRFADLGLLVIDEEHRFGVKHKERMKKLRASVDVLSMSATPIPRTLQMALGGLREMSVMTTPPQGRLEVRTSVATFGEARVRDAIQSELARGGQAYVIHNRVETIARFAERLRGWMPDVRFAVAHGQLDADALEDVLVAFMERRFDVLVCTTIFESGIDLPNVNTMLIHRADRFGLAQLYQLRGRVGRSDRRATCLLLTPEDVTPEARRRLSVLVENSRLGSGFAVAAADLELRGGGNVLGASQSGNIDQVGWETWVELLDEAVHHARGDAERDRIEPEIEVPLDAFLPDAWIPDTVERLDWYRKLAAARTPEAVERLSEELEGWFGTLPEEASRLVGQMITRLDCRAVGAMRVAWLRVRVEIELHERSPVLAGPLARALEAHPKRFSVDKQHPTRVSVRFTPSEAQRPYRFLRWVFAQLKASE